MKEFQRNQIDHYQIEALLGQGGMGAVYHAHDLNLERPVALKVMHDHLTRRPNFQQQFKEEAKAVARLNHPSIVQVYDFDRSEQPRYLVMELINGPTLADELSRFQKARQRINLHQTLIIAAQVAEALDAAHRLGVLHQDIKPGNIMLKPLDAPDRSGEPPIRAIVTDFGLAQLLQTGEATVTGKMAGTLDYLSPEQCLEQQLDGRSDIYSLGVILYEMVTGRLPFKIDSATTAYHKHVNEIPPAPRTIQPDLPLDVDHIVQTALAKRPEDRFAQAGAMAQALRQAAIQLTDKTSTQLPEAAVSTIAPRPAPTPGMRPTNGFSRSQYRRTSNGANTQPVQYVAPKPSTANFALSRPPVEDVAVIVKLNARPLTVPLHKSYMTLGRAEDNDIVLSDNTVSRHQLRLERLGGGGWQVYNFSQTNPTELEGSPLLSDLPERWEMGQTLRIGSYFMRWQSGNASVPIYQNRDTPAFGMPSNFQGDDSIHLVVTPTQINVKPGERTTLQVTITNMGMVPDHFYLRLQGLPPSWVTAPQEITQLMPGQQSSLPLTLHPPADSSADAGQHPFQILVSATVDMERVATANGLLTIAPFTQLALNLSPSHLQNKGTCQIVIENNGNSAVTCTLKGQDPANALNFSGIDEPVAIPNGRSKTIPLHIQPARRPWLGGDTLHTFTVSSRTETGWEESVQGQLDVRPRIPRWLLPLLVLLLPLCGALAFFTNSIVEQRATATAVAMSETVAAVTGTAESQSTQIAVNATGTATAVQATETSFAVIAITAQAEGDDDSDGVANYIELQNGLNPENADTDSDGLTDGEEFYQYGTNGNSVDTDEDGLDDYTELFVCETVPTNPDTDGDGEVDGIDPNPLRLPTATPKPTLPPTETPKPSPVPPTATPDSQELVLSLTDSGYISHTAPISYTIFTSSGQDAPIFRVGDGESNETYRGFLSFSLADLALPDNIQIVEVELLLAIGATSGDPFATLGNLIVTKIDYGDSLEGNNDDNKNIAYVSEGEKIITDFQLHQTAINLTDYFEKQDDHFQLRFQFEQDSDNDNANDFYFIPEDSEIKLIISFYANND